MMIEGAPWVIEEWSTIRDVVAHRCSLARFGDGEIKIMMGQSIKGQNYDPKLCDDLKGVALAGSTSSLMVGIPRIYDGIPEHKRGFWTRYTSAERRRFFDPIKRYYSSFITRPDHFVELDQPEYWARVRLIWKDRDVLFMRGAPAGVEPEHAGLLDNARSVTILRAPPRDAFANRIELMTVALEFCMRVGDKAIVLACVGPTATWLAAALSVANCQCIDLGHMPNFYAKRKELSEAC